MTYSPSQDVLDFTTIHDRCVAAWEHALQTGDTTALEAFAAPTYQGVFGHAGAESVAPVDRAEATAGVRQLVAALRGAVHRVQNRHVQVRGPREALVVYERIIERAGRVVARFWVLQTWRDLDDGWRVVRELAEQMGA